ncbi:hypothetical protein [Kribbella sp. CA-293567]|uniref:hypothetical protein n=1 Tax=Kribbella sp. CA-293567 TaxID=3002436 RepID=UPI0022DE5E6A|nr:hypothetical protein [Kribbella sp. CA-293567]WBQ07909.1 hypothetical protein OX958_14165 [Kribbella sp. CA-293567]
MIMGELSAAEWSAELERRGRVVFLRRERPNVRRSLPLLALSSGTPVVVAPLIMNSEGTERLFLSLGLGLSLISFVCLLVAVMSRRPSLVVTRDTIHVGKQPMTWPSDVRILRDYVTDLDTLETWLDGRRPASSTNSTSPPTA